MKAKQAIKFGALLLALACNQAAQAATTALNCEGTNTRSDGNVTRYNFTVLVDRESGHIFGFPGVIASACVIAPNIDSKITHEISESDCIQKCVSDIGVSVISINRYNMSMESITRFQSGGFWQGKYRCSPAGERKF